MLTYLLKPFDAQGLNNVIFNGPYAVLRDLLRQKGADLRTCDLGSPASADKVIFFNADSHLLRKCRTCGVGPERLVLVLCEPEVLIPSQYDPATWRHYGKVLTFRDDLIDHVRTFKFRYPQGQSLQQRLPSFEDRKLLTLINANKYSYAPNEGYSLRRRAIRFFDGHPGFDLYGYGWGSRRPLYSPRTALDVLRWQAAGRYCADVFASLRRFKSYKGAVPDKYHALAQYRFCLCFENELDTPGYITEKLFDCFFCGTVPIYLGASNIEDYVELQSKGV